MFLGEYFHSLDGKGRLVMPSSFRRRLEDGCVITKGRDGQLLIFASDDFEQKATEMIEQQPEDKEGRRFARTVFAGADLQTPDKSGRVIVKPDLRDYADLEPGTEIAVLGVFNHIELWEKGRHIQEKASGDESYLEGED